jgi:hypothetical protein
LARNRYGWQKRAKELARKQKHEDKMKRRQGKATPSPAREEMTQASEAELTKPGETDAGNNLPDAPSPTD